MSPTPRDLARADTLRRIVEIGRAHLSENGAAALSLRAVARDLGVVSSAVYRYVANRDELLTLLIVDAYDELGDAVDAALDGVPATGEALARSASGPRARWHALGHAIRDWALTEAPRYGLVFGGPVPGYAGPAEQTAAGTRVIGRIVEIALEAAALTDLADIASPEVPAPVAVDLSATIAAFLGGDVPDSAAAPPPALIARTTLAWTSLFGAVGFEVFGQYGPDGLTADPRALFDHELALLADLMGLP